MLCNSPPPGLAMMAASRTSFRDVAGYSRFLEIPLMPGICSRGFSRASRKSREASPASVSASGFMPSELRMWRWFDELCSASGSGLLRIDILRRAERSSRSLMSLVNSPCDCLVDVVLSEAITA